MRGEERRLKALILAGGEGREMKPLSEGYPKTLLKLLGKPIIGYVLDALVDLGIRSTIIVVNNVELFRKELSEYADKIEIQFIKQRKPEVEGAIISASNLIDEDEIFLLAYGDVIVPKEAYRILLNSYIDRDGDGAILITPQRELSTYGLPMINEEYVLTSIIEKPKEKYEVEYAVAGAYVLPGKFIGLLEESMDVTITINKLAKEMRIVTALWSGWWVDVGYPWDLITATENLLREVNSTIISKDAEISPRTIIEGPVIIDSKAVIDHNAIVRGPVYIGRNVYVGTGSLIRNYASIERDSIIGAYAEISRSIIQPGVSIGRLSFVGDSVVGMNSVIEPSVTTLNVLPSGVEVSRLHPVKIRGKTLSKLGAIIGNNSRVRAHTKIYPGTIIKSNETYPKE